MTDISFLSLFQYAFIERAFLAGAFVSVTCATLGVFLVLRRMSLIGDGLSHVSFGALALGLFMGVYPLYVALPLVIIGSYAILKITEKAKVYGDASIGIVSAIGIASGVILTSLSSGFNVDLLSYLFGNILAIRSSEVALSLVLSLFVLSTLAFFYWDFFSTTFDEKYAKTTGIKTELINVVLTVLTAITVVLSIKIVGVMLVSALLIIPAVTALQIARGFTDTLVFSIIFSLLAVFLGIITAFLFGIPAGAMIVLFHVFFFLSALVYKYLE